MEVDSEAVGRMRSVPAPALVPIARPARDLDNHPRRTHTHTRPSRPDDHYLSQCIRRLCTVASLDYLACRPDVHPPTSLSRTALNPALQPSLYVAGLSLD
jgi:hypothetical protein